MHESDIIIEATDQAAVRRVMAETALSKRLVLTGSIVLPIVLVLFAASALIDGSVALFGLGVVAALGLLFAILVVAARGVAGRSVVHGLPIGSRLRVRVDDDGMEVAGPLASSRAAWSAISGVERLKGAILVRNSRGKAWFVLPGRSLDDGALAAVQRNAQTPVP